MAMVPERRTSVSGGGDYRPTLRQNRRGAQIAAQIEGEKALAKKKITAIVRVGEHAMVANTHMAGVFSLCSQLEPESAPLNQDVAQAVGIGVLQVIVDLADRLTS